MQEIGGMMAARTLWEGAIVQSLLHGAGTWVGSDEDTDARCEELQLLFWRIAFQVPKSTPKVMLRANTNSLKMKQRIWMQKLLLATSILRKEKSLANEKYQQQMMRNWPGLSKEVEDICKILGVANINNVEVTKEELEEALFFHNYKEMKGDINKCEKLEDVKHETMRELSEYIKEKGIEKSRMAFRVRTTMVKTIKMNFKNSHRQNLVCGRCDMGENEAQCHAMTCRGWEQQRAGLDMSRLNVDRRRTGQDLV